MTTATRPTRRLLPAQDEPSLRPKPAHRTLLVQLSGSPGAGKTALIDATVRQLSGRAHIGVIVAHAGGERDADQLRGAGADAVVTIDPSVGAADQLDRALRRLNLDEIDILFIETPLEQPPDVGQTQRVALFSATGGDDKPAEFPQRVAGADLIVLSKIDLLPLVQFDVTRFRAETVRLNPRADLIELSLRNEFGMNTWIDWLLARQHALQSEPASDPSMPEWWFG